jgi:LPPG:FO 2-phospho-L-lactate transferase
MSAWIRARTEMKVLSDLWKIDVAEFIRELRAMIVALAGGVGAAKFLRGLVEAMPPEELTIISNTGDDIELFGLHISPDIDIVAYTLSGLVDEARGWGLQDDTFHGLTMLQRYGEANWFNLGDRDLATHILRTQKMRQGHGLTAITAELCAALGIASRILPMCDEPVPSLVRTPAGLFHFQEYLVQRGGEEEVLEIIYQGVEHATPAPGLLESLAAAEAILICPSNPMISVGTILAVPGVRQAVHQSPAPVVAISPIIQGATLKGPADKMLRGLGFEVSAYGTAQYYGDLLDGFIIDTLDAALQPRIEELGIRVEVTNTIMRTIADKVALARTTLTLARTCRRDVCGHPGKRI